MGFFWDFLDSVLPGPEEASPPIQQKYTAFWQNHIANSNFKKFRYFPLLGSFFFIVTDNTKTQLFYNFNSFKQFSSLHFLKRKFRYCPATFVKFDSGTSINKLPLLAFIFR
jgi:hypothetical protein